MALISQPGWFAATAAGFRPAQGETTRQTTGALPLPRVNVASILHNGQQRLAQALLHAPELGFDERSRFIIFSDTHRGDKGENDMFAPNEGIFLHALSHYYRSDFHYIELGDGDDLWRAADFSTIERAYPQIFALFRQFKARERLHLVVGNHEVIGPQRRRVTKGEFVAEEALVLRHRPSGKQLFAIHGHQMDLWCNQFALITQMLARLTHKGFEWFGVKADAFPARLEQHTQLLSRWYRSSQIRVNARLSAWAHRWQLPVISGHTHLHTFPQGRSAPYFNTGSGVNPGSITGIEIEQGALRLIEWVKTQRGDYERRGLSPALHL
jgi:UDP-2,3-diacylglucosamine pyrophosphatase LpxH